MTYKGKEFSQVRKDTLGSTVSVGTIKGGHNIRCNLLVQQVTAANYTLSNKSSRKGTVILIWFH